jgi:AcrR family transcriptional regulator
MKRASLTLAGGNRFERRRERTRLELLAAATRVLAEKGLHETKIADIAAAADMGVGTFYLHFPTKDALFDAVVEDTMRRLKAVVDEARRTAPGPVEKMLDGNSAFCRFADQNRQVFKIVFGHAAAYNDAIRRAQAMFAADIEETVREGVAAGVFAPILPEVAAQAIVGMATQLLSWWTERESIPLETLHETMATLALRGLGPATPKGDRDV